MRSSMPASLSKIFIWVIAIFLALVGIAALIAGDTLSSAILLITAILISPPLDAIYQRAFHFGIPLWAKILIAFFFLLLALLLANPNSPSQSTPDLPNATQMSLISSNDTILTATPIESDFTAPPNTSSVRPPSPSASSNIKTVLLAWGDHLPTEIRLEPIRSDTGPSAETLNALRANASWSSWVAAWQAVAEGYALPFAYMDTIKGTATIYRFDTQSSAEQLFLQLVGKTKEYRGYTEIKTKDDCFAYSTYYQAVTYYGILCLRSDIVYAIGFNGGSNIQSGANVLNSYADILDKQL